MVKPDEIPALWEETSAQRSSGPRQVRNWKRGIPSGRNRWRLMSTSNKMVGNSMNKCPKNEEFIVKAENDGARACLILSMVHYPNWQRETAQTRSSFGSNPK